MSKLFVMAFTIAILSVSGAAVAKEPKERGEDSEMGAKGDLELLKECCNKGAKCDINNDAAAKQALARYLAEQGKNDPVQKAK